MQQYIQMDIIANLRMYLKINKSIVDINYGNGKLEILLISETA